MNSQKGFVIPLIIAIVAILAIGGVVFVTQKKEVRAPIIIDPISTTTNPIIGGDKDEHGCLGPAGYSWCQVKNKCLRVWEEKCEVITTSTTTDQTDLPVIKSMDYSSGPKGTIVQIVGKNLSGFEGDLNVYFERADGKKILLKDTFGDYAKTGGSLIRVKVSEPCQSGQKVYGEYSGIESVCDYVELTPGTYKVYTEPWGVKSNVVNFTITAKSASCTPNWSCGWGECMCAPGINPCINGYQGMTAVDSNNCGLPSTGVQIACPALARQCATTN